MTLTCPCCGESFVRNHPLRRFCSTRCADRAGFQRRLLKRRAEDTAAPSTRACALPECGAEFVPKKPWGRYCSQQCNRIASRRRQLDREHAARGKPPVDRSCAPRPCLICERPFVPSQAKRSTQRYCSARCRKRDKYRRRHRKAKREPRPCLQCGVIMENASPGRRYCTPTCRERGLKARYAQGSGSRPRRLKCHYCSGHHASASCPNRYSEVVKQYGTMGPNREYVPPPGVKVRVRYLPPSVFGEDMKSQVGGRFGR